MLTSQKTDERMDPRRLRSRQKLTQTLGTLLHKKSLEDITIEEICNLSGVSRPTFYANYPNRQAIITDHLEKLLADIETAFDDFIDDCERPVYERLVILHKYVLTRLDFNDRILQLVIEGRAGPLALQMLHDFTNQLFMRRLQNVQQHHLNTDMQKIIPIFYAAAVNGVILAIYRQQIAFEPEKIAEQISDLIQFGMQDKIID